MTLYIHNTLTKSKQPFKPIDESNVRMYVCGMTVYDYCHIGHARVLVVFDMVYRHLCNRFGKAHVTYVRNITDIDDKIIQRANDAGVTMQALTGQFISAMHDDADALGVLRPQQEPRATTHMESILAMIQRLEENGYAYVGSNGDVFFAVKQFKHYGALSGKKAEDQRAGERVAIDEHKRDPGDFVLWKMAKPGEPSWDSPWGNGRPGWHIECSAMSTECLGNHFDIHGGGLDLQFPHHENEIAQSEAANQETFVNVWMHNGFVRVDDEKMSKSLGNFFTIREVLARYHPEVVRFFILSSHYRSPLNYSDQHLDNARAALTTLYTALRGLDSPNDFLQDDNNGDFRQRFDAAMDDDFNSPEAIAVLFEIAKAINRARQDDITLANRLGSEMKMLADSLGLLQQAPDQFLRAGSDSNETDADYVEAQIAARLQARKNKDWAESDAIRDALEAKGIILEDAAGTTTWRRK